MAAKNINNVEIDIQELPSVFKALDLRHFMTTNDESVVNFIKNTFSRCDRLRHLVLPSFCSLDWILSALHPLSVHHLNSITMNDIGYFGKVPVHMDDSSTNDPEKVNIIVVDYLNLNGIIRHLKCFKKSCLHICCGISNKVDLSTLFHENISELLIENCAIFKSSNKKVVQIRTEISLCPFLTNICFRDLNIEEKVLVLLSKAVTSGHLPKLSHLRFKNCGSSVQGKLHKLFNSSWIELLELDLDSTSIDITDIEAICKGFLPNLTSFTLFLGDAFVQNTSRNVAIAKLQEKWRQKLIRQLLCLLDKPCFSLLKFHLQGADENAFKAIISDLNTMRDPTLTDFGIEFTSPISCTVDPIQLSTMKNFTMKGITTSGVHTQILQGVNQTLHKLDMSNITIGGNLSIVLCHNFPSLSTLVLSNCELTLQDVKSLTLSNINGKFPELKHLDLSENEAVAREVHSLLEGPCTWRRLVHLNVKHIKQASLNSDMHVLTSKCLPSLEELTCSVHEGRILPISDSDVWNNLHTLTITLLDGSDGNGLTRIVAFLVKERKLPNLRYVRFMNWTLIISNRTIGGTYTYYLRQNGIRVSYCAVFPWDKIQSAAGPKRK